MTARPDRPAAPPASLVEPDPARPDLAALLDDDARIDAAVAAAQRAAVRAHHLLGRPVVVWRDGRVVEQGADPTAPAGEPDTPPAATHHHDTDAFRS